jgi:hypothetical protein
MISNEDYNSGIEFECELRDARNGRYLGNMKSWFANVSMGNPYRVGESIPMPDSEMFRNNSKRIRDCVIQRVEVLSFSKVPRLYLMPTKKEIRCGRIDGEKVFGRKINGIDWSGSDGWLNPNSRP